MRSGYVPEVQKIAVLRANRLGDFIFALPALESLHFAYPEAELVLLALPWHARFLYQRPGPVDRVVVVPPYAGVSVKPGEAEDKDRLEQFFQAMRQERFDLACQLHGGGQYSNPFIVRLGARETVGLKAQDAIALDRWIPYHYFQHEILRYLEVVSLVGAVPLCHEPHLAVTEQDIVELEAVLPGQKRPLVVLHPGASDPRRRWPAEKFARVGDTLTASGATVVVTGMEPERRIVEQVTHTMRAESVNLCGHLSLGALAALLSRSCVVVSNDSGPLHLAHAVGARTVGIYWCFNLMNGAPLSRLRHRPLVSWQLNCPICGCDHSHGHCSHSASFVSDIPVEEVIASVQDLMAE